MCPPCLLSPTPMQKCTDKCNKQQLLKNITAPVSMLNIGLYSRLIVKDINHQCQQLMHVTD